MGALTLSQLISEGGLLVGDDTQTVRAKIWFKAWLRKVYASWQWPFCKARVAGISLATGATSLTVGAGTNVTENILRIFEPLYVYTSDKRIAVEAPIRELLMQRLQFDESSRDTSLGRSIPTSFKLRAYPGTWGKWSLIPFPVPDRDYLVAFDYHFIPADPGDSDIPVYPNDQTLIQAAKCAVLEYADGPASQAVAAELEVLADRVSGDRDQFGGQAGDGDFLQLDSSVFR